MGNRLVERDSTSKLTPLSATMRLKNKGLLGANLHGPLVGSLVPGVLKSGGTNRSHG